MGANCWLVEWWCWGVTDCWSELHCVSLEDLYEDEPAFGWEPVGLQANLCVGSLCFAMSKVSPVRWSRFGCGIAIICSDGNYVTSMVGKIWFRTTYWVEYLCDVCHLFFG